MFLGIHVYGVGEHEKKARVLPWDSNTRISRIYSGSSDPRNGKNSET